MNAGFRVLALSLTLGFALSVAAQGSDGYIVILKDQVAAMIFPASVAPAQPLHDPPLIDRKSGTPQVQAAVTSRRVQALVATGSVLESLSREVQPSRVYDSVFMGFSAELTAAEAAALRADPLVAAVLPEQVFTASEDCRDLGGLPCSQNLPGLFPWGLARISRPDFGFSTSYFAQRSGLGVTAFVIDSGIRESHDEFPFGIDGWWTAFGDINDCTGHGTHVSSTIAGRQYGVAKRVGLVPMRVFGCQPTTETAIIINALDAVHRAVTSDPNRWLPAVVNMSLGGPGDPGTDLAVRRVIAAGVPVVVAAGNEASNACGRSPARVSEAITVAASTHSDTPASFTNWGPCVDLFAPGFLVPAAGIANDSQIVFKSGTSMAAPHVAGVVATYLDRDALTPPTPVPWPSPVGDISAALIAQTWKNKLTGSLNGSPNQLLSGRWSDLTAPTCRDRVLATGDSPLAFYLSGYDCQLTPKGAGYYGASFRIAGTAGQEMRLEAFGHRGFQADLVLLAPDGTAVGFGPEITYVPPVTGQHTLWLSSLNPWSTGNVRVSYAAPGAPDPLTTITSQILRQPAEMVRGRGPYAVELRMVNNGPALQLFPLRVQTQGQALMITRLEADGTACDLPNMRCIVNQWPTGGAVNVQVDFNAVDSHPASLVVGRKVVDLVVHPSWEQVFLGNDSNVVVPVGSHLPAEAIDARAAVDTTLTDEFRQWVIDRVVVSGGPSTGGAAQASLRILSSSEGRPDEASPLCARDAVAMNGPEMLLDPPCRLTTSAIWMTFEPRLDTAGATWNWKLQNGSSGAPDLWRNPANGTNKNCRDWGLITRCLSTAKTDLGYRLDGWVESGGQTLRQLTTTIEEMEYVGAAASGVGHVIAYRGRFGTSLWLQRIDRTGAATGSPVEVFQTVQAADLAADGAGNVLVVATIAPDADSPPVLWARGLASNGTLSAPTEVTSVGWPTNPAVACAPGGQCLVAWIDNVTTMPAVVQRRVAARPFNVDATANGGQRTISNTGTDGAGPVDVASVGTKGFVAVWARRLGIWSRFVAEDATPSGQVFRVDRGAGTHTSPSVAGMSDGTVVYGWRTANGGTSDLSLQQLDATGAWCSADVLLRRPRSSSARIAPSSDYGPAVALHRDPETGASSWTAAWLGETSNPYVYARSGSGCTADSLPFYLAEAPGGFERWSPALAANGSALLGAWSTQRTGADPITWRLLPDVRPLQNGTAASGRFTAPADDFNWEFYRPLVSDERWHFYRVEVPPAATTFEVTVDGVTHGAPPNLDLFLWRNAFPGTAPPDCSAAVPGTLPESCRITANVPGIWWAGVKRQGNSSASYSVTARW